MMHTYLLAIVPPSPWAEKMEQIRHEFALNFPSEEGLRRPLHATLFTPFRLPGPMPESHMVQLTHWTGRQPVFEMTVKNFGFFERPKSPVIYFDVVASPALLALNEGLSLLVQELFGLDEHRQQPVFHPHFTIGFRDLSLEIFPDIRRAYSTRSFNAHFEVNQVVLFRYIGRQHHIIWEPYASMPLGSRQPSS